MRRQCHDHRDASIISSDRNRLIMKYGIYKGHYLSNKTLTITFDEEMKWEISSHAAGITNDCVVRVVVVASASPRTAKQPHKLVIAIDGMAAVADCANDAVLKSQHDNCIVCIADRGDVRIAYSAGLGKDLLYFVSNQETGHIEVMDRHVEEDAAGDSNILNRWRGRVTADDMNKKRLADLSLFPGLSTTGQIAVKEPHESPFQLHPTPFTPPPHTLTL